MAADASVLIIDSDAFLGQALVEEGWDMQTLVMPQALRKKTSKPLYGINARPPHHQRWVSTAA